MNSKIEWQTFPRNAKYCIDTGSYGRINGKYLHFCIIECALNWYELSTDLLELSSNPTFTSYRFYTSLSSAKRGAERLLKRIEKQYYFLSKEK